MLDAHVIDINWGGLMCGGLEMYSNGIVKKSCPCYKVVKNEGNYSLVLTIKFSWMSHGHKKILVASEVTGRKISKLLLATEGFLSRRIDASTFKDVPTMSALMRSIVSQMRYVNMNGGWKVLGWCRQGGHVDAAFQDTSLRGRDDNTNKVSSSLLMYHISSLEPFDYSRIDDARWNALKLNVSEL